MLLVAARNARLEIPERIYRFSARNRAALRICIGPISSYNSSRSLDPRASQGARPTGKAGADRQTKPSWP
jgi:hypothetical protein